MTDEPKNPIVSEFEAEFGETPLAPVDTSHEAPPEVKPPTAPAKPAKPAKFRKEIDLHDGSGVQVFEAETEGGLIDKLTTAQENATRKIRSQERQLKTMRRAPASVPPPKPLEPPKPLSADERLALESNPAGVIDRFEKLQFQLYELQQKEAAQEQARQNEAARAESTKEFLSKHPEYIPSVRNSLALQDVIVDRNLDTAPENFTDTLEAAYEEVLASGGFPDKPAAQSAPPASPAAQPRIGATMPAKPASSGISESVHTEPTEINEAQAVEEAYRIPLHELRERIQRRAYAEQHTGRASK